MANEVHGRGADDGAHLLAAFRRLLTDGDRSTREARRERKREVLQFLVDELLAEPEPFLTWLFTRWKGPWFRAPCDVYLREAFREKTGRPLRADLNLDALHTPVNLAQEFRAPAWAVRLRQVGACVRADAWYRYESGEVETLPPRWADGWIGSPQEVLALYYLVKGGAPAEDYRTGFSSDNAEPGAPEWVVHSPPAAEFIFRGDPFELHRRAPGAVDLSAAVAHGVWYRREHTWCDTPVGGPNSPLDSPSIYSRTARGLLRLPNLCPACERFYRAQIGRPGNPVGGLRAFAAQQLLDAPPDAPPAREEDLALLGDPDVMLGDAPLPPSPGDYPFDE